MPSKVVSISSGDRAGVIAARNALVEANLNLVRPIAEHVARSLPPSFDLDDLIGTGYLGLIYAAGRYKPAAHGGAAFAPFARKWIKGRILDSIRRRHYVETTKPPSDEAPEPFARPDIELSIDTARTRQRLHVEISHLPPEQRVAIQLRYGAGLPWAEVGRELDVTASRACQIRIEAVGSLKKSPYLRGLAA